ncbi:MAG: hypothetical protein R2791_12445 [Saprospiraceae bacterium]
MKLNFKYYNTGSLIVLILVLSVIYVMLKEGLGAIVHIPEPLQIPLDALNEYLGWVSPLAFIGVVFFVINEYLWRYPWMNWLVDVPDLNGRYKGELVSSYVGTDGQQVKKECVLEITQNASAIHVYAYHADKGSTVQTSMAYSITEEIVKEKNGSFTLYYLYANEPDSMIEALNKHNGTAKFIYLADKRQLVGEYYNHRLNKGTMNLTFEGKKRFHRFAQ